jgi:anti-sigma factor RsiW
LSDFLDESTDPATRADLEKHVSECVNCWVVFDTTKRTIQVYKGMEPQPLPEEVHTRLVKAIEKKKTSDCQCASHSADSLQVEEHALDKKVQ